jgi:hypothetical protein
MRKIAFAGRVAVLAAAVFAAGAVGAQDAPSKLGAGAGPMEHLKGRWTGTGIATLSTGRQEPFNCVATYFQEEAGNVLRQNLRCESPNVKVAASAQLRISGEAIAGVWQERQYDADGSIKGKLTSVGFDAVVTHKSRQVEYQLRTGACEQTVSVQARPGEVLQTITATMKRC